MPFGRNVRSASHKVVFSPDAKADLLELYDYIAEASGAARAIGYIARIERKCLNLALFPHRGRPRDDVREGLRVIGFERNANIAIDGRTVTVLRILYGGRDLGRALSK
jgi:toxin ParE1/3/4